MGKHTERKLLALPFIGCASVIAVATTTGSCIALPQPDLPTPPNQPPEILHAQVTPPEQSPLTVWPDGTNSNVLLVPVLIDDTNDAYEYRVFVDRELRPEHLTDQPTPPPVVDGETILQIAIVPANQSPPIDLGTVHTIKVVVAHAFVSGTEAPDEIGSDTAEWTYGPCGFQNDCGSSGTGQEADAAGDRLSVPPLDEGGE